MKRSFKPSLMSFEDRLVPAASITVNTTSDAVNGNTANIAALIASPGSDGKISLREAVLAANGTSSSGTSQATANIINLPAGTYTITGDYLEVVGGSGGTPTNANTWILGASRSGTILQTTNTSGLFATGKGSSQNTHFGLSRVTVQNFQESPVYVRGQSGNGASFDDVRFLNNRSTAGGGAIFASNAGGFGCDLTLTNCSFEGNTAAAGGGAVFWQPLNSADIAQMTVTGCSFTGNTAQGAGGGGAIYTVGFGGHARANISNSSFTGNIVSSAGAEGGGALHMGGAELTLVRNSFSGNQVTAVTTAGTSGGGAVLAGPASFGIAVNFNRFVNNTTAKTGDADEVLLPGGAASGNINDNWWGQNTGPATGDLFNQTPTTWLQLRHSANPTVVPLSGVATISADLLGLSNGTVTAAGNLVGLPSFAATYSKQTLGTLSNASTQFVNGLASATFTGGTTAGAGGATVTADAQSLAAAVQVTAAPFFSQQPASITVAAPGSAKFTVATASTPTPTVKWQVSIAGGAFTDIAGATAMSYTLASTSSADNGNRYQAILTNGGGSKTSDIATLTVNFAPAVTAHPSNTFRIIGAPSSYTAAASGSPAPTVQWQKSVAGGPFVDIPGAIATTYNAGFNTAADHGNRYRAVFTNSLGTATSLIATQHVYHAPAVTTQPVNSTVMSGQSASFTAASTGFPVPGVKWQVSIAGGAFTDIPGATAATYTIPATMATENGNQYRAVFTNDRGTGTSNAATLTVTPAVSGLTVNAGAVQRSRITEVNVNFTTTRSVTIFQNPGAVTLTRTTGGPATTITVGSGLIVTPGSGNAASIKLTFQDLVNNGVDNASLADGRWQVGIPSLGYQSTLNDTSLRRLFGDSNNDGTVNAGDLADFGNAFGRTIPNSAFDFDNNGTINALDLADFGNRFGITL